MQGVMSNTTVSERSPRVLFLGMECDFSSPPLRALLESGIEVCAVIVPTSRDAGATGRPQLRATSVEHPLWGRGNRFIEHVVAPTMDEGNELTIHRREPSRSTRSTLPMLGTSSHPSLLQLAWERQVPVWEVHHLSHPETVSVLAAYQPDVIAVACFSQRIPRVILELPRLGCLNVHPSLLPANRGPVPLFWTFREGCEKTGITLHLMDEGMDTGDILAQAPLTVPDGMSYTELELLCATLGGELLVRTIGELYEGRAVRTPQDETKSSYHSFPSDDDFVVQAANWSARHVYNFICGVAGWGEPIRLYADDKSFIVREAVSYSHRNGTNTSAETCSWLGEELSIRCRDGWVRVKL
jgi:methionyl-tRNA formyltransferase